MNVLAAFARSSLIIASCLVLAAGSGAAVLASAHGLSMFPAALFFGLLFGSVIGLPVFLWFRGKGKANQWRAAACGAFLAGFFPMSAALPLASSPDRLLFVAGPFVLMYLVAGACAGYGFWRLFELFRSRPEGDRDGLRVATLVLTAGIVIAAANTVDEFVSPEDCRVSQVQS